MSSFPTTLPRLSHADDSTYSGGTDPEPDGGVDIDLADLARQMSRNRLDEIKHIVRELRYGEMIELCAEISLYFPPGQNSFCLLPETMHRWSNGDGRSRSDRQIVGKSNGCK